ALRRLRRGPPPRSRPRGAGPALPAVPPARAHRPVRRRLRPPDHAGPAPLPVGREDGAGWARMARSRHPEGVLRIGPFALDPPVVLAPMAGVTNPPFRRLCRSFGAGLYVSEMITSRGLVEG